MDEVPSLPEATVDPICLAGTIQPPTNILRYTPEGGKIRLNGETGHGEVVLSIRDNGEGLDADQLSAVFNRFYRADKSRCRETGAA